MASESATLAALAEAKARITALERERDELLGASSEQLSAEGRGARDPIADHATPAGREQNRQVELQLDAEAAAGAN
jgi:type VI secretion system protein ImpK